MSRAVVAEKLYKIGEVVPTHGMYMCVPCGYVQEFKAGELFVTCELCLAGTLDGPEEYQETDVEFWHLLEG